MSSNKRRRSKRKSKVQKKKYLKTIRDQLEFEKQLSDDEYENSTSSDED